MKKRNPGLEAAIEYCGSPAELARRAKVSPQVISNARRRGRVSINLAERIELGVDGHVSRAVLAWPPEEKPTPKRQKARAA